MTLEFRTLPAWPRTPTKNRRESPFRAHYQDTLDLLMKELHARRARTVAILAAFEAQGIRRDGFPRTSATPKHPGIIVFLTTEKGEHLSFPCDTFLDWKDERLLICGTRTLFARNKSRNMTLGDSVNKSDITLRETAHVCFFNLFDGGITEFYLAVKLSYISQSGLDSVDMVPRRGHIFKINQGVILFIAIFVVDLRSFGSRSKKSLRYESMDRSLKTNSINIKTRHSVTMRMRSRTKNPSCTRSFTSGYPSYSSFIAYFIVRKIWNYLPFLHRLSPL